MCCQLKQQKKKKNDNTDKNSMKLYFFYIVVLQLYQINLKTMFQKRQSFLMKFVFMFKRITHRYSII